MEEPTQQGSEGASKHTQRLSEIDFHNVRVVQSDGLRAAFGKLYKAVKQGGFDRENLLSLKEFANFSETNLRQLLIELPQIAQQCEEHVAATGDTSARHALRHVIDSLASEKGITLLGKSSPRLTR